MVLLHIVFAYMILQRQNIINDFPSFWNDEEDNFTYIRMIPKDKIKFVKIQALLINSIFCRVFGETTIMCHFQKIYRLSQLQVNEQSKTNKDWWKFALDHRALITFCEYLRDISNNDGKLVSTAINDQTSSFVPNSVKRDEK